MIGLGHGFKLVEMGRYCKTKRGAASAQDVTYPSIRRPEGACIGAFRPRAVGLPVQERHLQYRWNGERADRYFDYSTEAWTDV